jgi:hypothetical protein
MHYTDANLQMTTNSNKVLVTSSEVEAGNFTTMAYNGLINVGKSVLKMAGVCGKVAS